MSNRLKDSHIAEKFQGATNTQDSIQTLSLWVLHHRAHHQRIVSMWIKVLQKAKMSHRLTLFYLANDVIQNSKRKGFAAIVNSFAGILRDATLLVRNDNIRSSVERVFKIWEQRNVFESDFVSDLLALLNNSKTLSSVPTKLLADFKPESIIVKMKAVQKIEQESSSKLGLVNLKKLNATNAEIVQQFKDRVHGQQFKSDFDENVHNLENLVETMSEEIKNKSDLILLLEQGGIYYETQNKEAKQVANAYKNFDGRVKSLEKKLQDVINSLPSPVPSPTADAPSPTTSDRDLELQLPNEEDDPAKQLENLENVPSPVGTPEGLNIPPDHDFQEEKDDSKKSIGNPIPTLSNFFGHEDNEMSSWLGAFSSTQASKATFVKTETKKADGSSLDSRLSNLLQNIPNLPSGFQGSLLSSSSTFSNAPNILSSPIKKEKNQDGSLTPVKDEYSGQNTPLQDEDNHSSHSFLGKQSAINNKTQCRKDTSDAMNPSSENGVKNRGTSSQSSTNMPFGQIQPVPSFIRSVVPPTGQHISTTYYTPPQKVTTIGQTIPTTDNSYQMPPFSSMASYASPPPTIDNAQIPTMASSASFNDYPYPSESFASQEYNPEMEMYDVEMDVDDPLDDDVPSPEIEQLTPPRSSSASDELSRTDMPKRRLSTLITVVTEETPLVPPEKDPTSDKSDKENVTNVPPPTEDSPPKETIVPFAHVTKPSPPQDDFFIGNNEPVAAVYQTAPTSTKTSLNGDNSKRPYHSSEPVYPPMQRQPFQMDDMNGGRQFENCWEDDNRHHEAFLSDRLPEQGNFYHQNNNFRPRNSNWSPRHRPDGQFQQKRNGPYPQRPFNPPHNQRFPFRGRGGWGRNQNHY